MYSLVTPLFVAVLDNGSWVWGSNAPLHTSATQFLFSFLFCNDARFILFLRRSFSLPEPSFPNQPTSQVASSQCTKTLSHTLHWNLLTFPHCDCHVYLLGCIKHTFVRWLTTSQPVIQSIGIQPIAIHQLVTHHFDVHWFTTPDAIVLTIFDVLSRAKTCQKEI